MKTFKLLSRLIAVFGLMMFGVSGWGAADLSITKTVNNATPNIGDNITYTIVGTNTVRILRILALPIRCRQG